MKGKFSLDEKIQYYTMLIEMNPEYADAYYNRGLAYEEKDEFEKAINDLKKASELDQKRGGRNEKQED